MIAAALHRGSTFARLTLAIAALVVCAWFALAISQLRDVDHVRAFLHQHPVLTASQAKALNAQLSDAARLNPDRSIDTQRALVESQAHDAPAALRVAEALARREPQNVENWLLVEFLAGRVYPAAYRLAQTHIKMLAPPVPLPG